MAGFFSGEYSLSGTSFQWKRNRKPDTTLGTLPLACEHVPGPDITYTVFDPPPTLKPGPRPTGTGALEDGITGTGVRVKTSKMRQIAKQIPKGMTLVAFGHAGPPLKALPVFEGVSKGMAVEIPVMPCSL